MSRPVITLDFHNTLVECDPWFELEVYTLASSFLTWHAAESGVAHSAERTAAADRIYREIRRGIHEHGHELPADRALHVVLDQLHISLDPSTVERGLSEIMAHTLTDASPAPGAPELVRDLAAAQARLIVISSAVYHPFLIWALERFDMLPHFEQVVTSASSGFYKSRPEIYWRSLALIGSKPEEAVHVGDSLTFDVHAAADAGLRTAWVSRGRALDTLNGDRRPDLVIDALSEAAPMLLGVIRDGR